jgi:hypothetical protein
MRIEGCDRICSEFLNIYIHQLTGKIDDDEKNSKSRIDKKEKFIWKFLPLPLNVHVEWN